MTDLIALDVSREEVAWKTLGAASARVRQAGETLVAAFEEYDRRRDELTEARFGEGQPHWGKPVSSAYAAWRSEQLAERQLPPVEAGHGWPVREEAAA